MNKPPLQDLEITGIAILATAVLALLLQASPAQAYDLDQGELNTRFSAKVAKERTRQNTIQQMQDRNDRFDDRFGVGQGRGVNGNDCGSQNIGNVNTGGRTGSQPREVFVYAPNSVNVVTRGGCR